VFDQGNLAHRLTIFTFTHTKLFESTTFHSKMMSSGTSVNERAAMIKKQQEEALARLPLHGLFIVLWIRKDPPRQNDFHWGYYYHAFPKKGLKYHIQNLGSGWIPSHGETAGVFKSIFLCVLIQIATIPEKARNILDQLMRSHDGELYQIPGVTCRVWLLRILQKLIQHGLVRCSNPDALEQECMSFGNRFSLAAAENNQPRPVVRSRLCF
jgi:hypothetical protein